MKSLSPAYLWIGQQETLMAQALLFIKQVLCADKACNRCTTCKLITNGHHHLVRWFVPQNQYTLAHLDSIFSTILYKLGAHDHFFFVLERADLLSLTCANSLLKSLEEPPEGYHFILLSPRLEAVLPTVVSRCVINVFNQKHVSQDLSLVRFFISERLDLDFVGFAKELDRLKPNERDIIDFIDQIYAYWSSVFKNNLKNSKAEHMLDLLNRAYNQSPMPGSAKMFLKNLFLQYAALTQSYGSSYK